MLCQLPILWVCVFLCWGTVSAISVPCCPAGMLLFWSVYLMFVHQLIIIIVVLFILLDMLYVMFVYIICVLQSKSDQGISSAHIHDFAVCARRVMFTPLFLCFGDFLIVYNDSSSQILAQYTPKDAVLYKNLFWGHESRCFPEKLPFWGP